MKQVFLFLAILIPQFAKAATFANQFIEFQLPSKWECKLDGTEWVCQSNDEQKKRDAIIVLAAKIKRAGMDELPIYLEHLKKKQEYTSLSGDKVSSEPRYVKELDISGHKWIDALHAQSEIPDFYTRYLATVEADLGILVTFSVRKDKYNEYAPDIEAMVKTLRAFRKPGMPNQSTDTAVATAPSTSDPALEVKVPVAKPKKAASDDSDMMVLGLVLVVAVIVFIIWKKKKKG